MKKLKKLLLVCLTAMLLTSQPFTVLADDTSQSSDNMDTAREKYRTQLNQYYTNLKYINDIDEDLIKKMDKIYNSGMSFMKSASFSQSSEIASYESTVEASLKELLGKQPSATKEFIMLSNVAQVTDVSYNQTTMVPLSLINLGNVDVQNVVVTPKVSNDKTKWPFDITQPYDAQLIPILQAASSTEEAMTKRMDIGWNFTVRDDVLTGCYPLPFTVTYYLNGALETTELTTYINVMGKDPKKLLIKDDTQLSANPRIIVTGFKTNPETVYAGSVFEIAIQVRNTSKDTTVRNVLFNLEATVEGTTSDATYAAFLPTSGSSSVYTDAIAPGADYEMSIEMEAKADLAQKPYVLTISMSYDTDEQINLTNTANVSVPIRQAAKMDLSTASVSPSSIAVGEEADIMFNIYNTGKTTLFNVKVTYEDETIDGGGLTYLGNITPGSTGNVDSMVTGIAQDPGDGIIKAIITYEDESGNETREEKEFNLSVYEMVFDDMGMDFEEPMEEPEQSNTGLIIAIIVVAVIVLLVVVIVIIKKKRSKQRHQEDLDLLDDEE